MKNKVVWITGASSGIGEGLAREFSRLGAKLILSARRENELQRVKDNCANPEDIFILPLDLSDIPSLAGKAAEAIARWGRLDILINNGGISQRSQAADTSHEVELRMMDINFFSYIALSKAVIPQMKKQKYGHLVITSSVLGKFGLPLRSTYAASKHALHGYFDSLREELKNDGIHVLLVCPGYIKTNVTLHAVTETGDAYGKMAEGQEKGMEPEVCARKIIRAIERKKPEVLIGGKEIIMVYLKRYLPSLFRKVLSGIKP
jgi:dehydrogenase/reductase SDR family member 7B